MPSGSSSGIWGSLRLRLAALYSIMFVLLTTAAFSVQYLAVRSAMNAGLDRELADELREWQSIYELFGLDGITAEFISEKESLGANGVVCKLYGSDGGMLATSPDNNWKLPTPPSQIAATPGAVQLDTIELAGPPYSIRVGYLATPEGNVFLFGRPREQATAILAVIFRWSALTVIVMTIVSALVGYLIAKRAFAGIDALGAALKAVSRGEFTTSLQPIGGGSEIEALKSAFDEMRRRIHSLITELREVSDNVAHDLRTPLARIHAGAETLLTTPLSPEQTTQVEAMLHECDHLSNLIDAILAIAEADASDPEKHGDLIDLNHLVRQTSELFTPLAEAKNLRFSSETTMDPAMVRGDNRQLQRAVSNLVDNAIKFTETGGVHVAVQVRSPHVFVVVSDTGCGISSTEADRVFAKFYRADSSRTLPGNGLGLSFVKSVVTVHGGTITLSQNNPNGLIITLRFPQKT